MNKELVRINVEVASNGYVLTAYDKHNDQIEIWIASDATQASGRLEMLLKYAACAGIEKLERQNVE